MYVKNCLYPDSSKRSTIDSIDTNLRKSLYINEITGLTPEQKQVQKQLSVQLASTQLNNQNIRGFNMWAFLLGVAGFHTGRIFQTKVLFHEMGKGAVNHAAIAVGAGVLSGVLIGTLFSYDMGLYTKWRKARRTVDRYERDLAIKK
jgi:hypothetical protein